MRIHMYMSWNQVLNYRQGRVARGVSKEALQDYPYMKIHVDVPESDVIGIDAKTMPIYDSEDRKTGQTYEFTQYDVLNHARNDE